MAAPEGVEGVEPLDDLMKRLHICMQEWFER
jgi:hypothetical protein